MDLSNMQAQNSLTGSIPDMASLSNLRVLDVSRNSLVGPLPAYWAHSSTLELFAAEQNQLTGTIPTSAFPFPLRYLGNGCRPPETLPWHMSMSSVHP